MNVNVKLSLTNGQRRAIASLNAGKPVKRLATRREVNELVAGMLASAVAGSPTDNPVGGPLAPADTPDAGEEFCSEHCCTQNRLLLNRVNTLQTKLDRRR